MAVLRCSLDTGIGCQIFKQTEFLPKSELKYKLPQEGEYRQDDFCSPLKAVFGEEWSETTHQNCQGCFGGGFAFLTICFISYGPVRETTMEERFNANSQLLYQFSVVG